MIDLAALASLFFEASKEWREPKVVQFDRLEDAEEEQVVRDLKAKGHERQWVRGHRLRQLKQKGWEPIVERDSIGRPTIFMDRLKELVYAHRARTDEK